jgi:hypothetical protein
MLWSKEWDEKRRLYDDWQRAARKLVESGYERQDCRNPNVPVMFRQNGTTVILVRETPQSGWTVKELEPLET